MALSAFLDAVSGYLGRALAPSAPASIGGAEPDGPAQLPAVTLSLAGVTSPHPGVGATPRAPATGALATSAVIDLAAPWIDFPDGRAMLLLEGGTVVQLPHGAIVDTDGEQALPFEPKDLTVTRTIPDLPTVTYVVVDKPPAKDRPELRADPVTGRLTFGAALTAPGKIEARYFVGAWEVRSERFAGDLRIDAFAGDAAATEQLSRRIELALGRDRLAAIAGLRRLSQTGWGPLGPAVGLPSARCRSLAYRFEYEREEPVVLQSGGPIGRVTVRSSAAGAGETFDVTTREGSR